MSLLALSMLGGCTRSTEHPASKSSFPKSSSSGRATGQSVIFGHVFFSGEPPAPRVFSIATDQACTAGDDERQTSEDVVVNGNGNGTLRNVFVYVSTGVDDVTFEPPSTPVVLDQKGCRFVPHVLGIQTGQPLRLVNSDQTLHNVHARASANQAFNLGMTVKTPEARRVFTAPEIMIPIRCNVHPWMEAYIGVVNHPFFSVTDEAGTFALRRLPAGNYTLEAWHEKLGRLQTSLTVTGLDSSFHDFSFVQQRD